MGWDTLNLIETIGAFVIALSVLIFFVNMIYSHASAVPLAGDDPWDGRSLEWSIPSPPPEYNFAEIPVRRGPRRLVAPQVHRGRRRPAGAAAVGRRRRRRAGRGRDRGHRPTTDVAVGDAGTSRSPSRRARRRARHPHAVAVVLPARRRRRPARSSATPRCSSEPRGSRSRVCSCCCSASTPGASSPATEPRRRWRPSSRSAIRATVRRASWCRRRRRHDAAATTAHATAHRRHQPQARRCGCSCRPTACSSARSSPRTCSTATAPGRPGRRRRTSSTSRSRRSTSFILLMSSLTMVLALAAIQRGDYRRFRIWIMATALFGATFIGGQIFEFTEFTREGLNLDTNLFGSSFFVLTGLHGAHVHRRHRVAGLAVGPVDAEPPLAGRLRTGRDRRALLALRRRRVDRDLHRHLPDPEVRRQR